MRVPESFGLVLLHVHVNSATLAQPSASDTPTKAPPGCGFRALNAADSPVSCAGGQISGGVVKGPSNRLLHRSVVSAGRRSPPRGQVEGAAAASAGFQRASFRTLIASAFCPPPYRSPLTPPNARRFSARQKWRRCGVARATAEVSGSDAL